MKQVDVSGQDETAGFIRVLLELTTEGPQTTVRPSVSFAFQTIKAKVFTVEFHFLGALSVLLRQL